MKKERTTYLLILIIGILSIAFSIYSFLKGNSFERYFSGGLLGVILAGMGMIYFMKKNKDSEEQMSEEKS